MRRHAALASLLLAAAWQLRPEEPEPEELARALAGVSELSVAADVRFLADDELGGRATVSFGQRVAARYLAARAAQLGLEPGALRGDGRADWFHAYPLATRRVEAKDARATLRKEGGERELAYGRDFAVQPSDVAYGEWRGEVAWIGSADAEALAGVDLAGRWALCSDPGPRRRARVKEVAARGALGALFAQEPPGGRTFDNWVQRAARGGVGWPRATGGERAPSFWLSSETAAGLRAGAEESALAVGAALEGEIEIEIAGGGTVQAENVCALWRGSDPEREREVIVVSAHYDHVGTGASGEVYNGADDNASGTSALLAVGEALAAHGPLKRSVVLVWVSGEEIALLGSRAWAEAPPLPEGWRAVADINLDMVGRNAPEKWELTPSKEHPERNVLADAAERAAGREGFGAPASADRDWGRSDHASFAEHLGIPVCYFSGGEHEDYHKPTDDAEKIDARKVARFARVVVRMLHELQGAELAKEPEGAAAGAK